LYGRLWTIASGLRRLRDLRKRVHAGSHFAKHGVLGGAGREPIKVGVVGSVDEDLAAAAVRAARVRHGYGAWLVGDLGIGGMLVGNGAMRRVAGASSGVVRIFAVWAAELNHETINNAVEVQAVVKAALGQGQEVEGCLGHLVCEQLDREVAQGGVKKCGRVCHGRQDTRPSGMWTRPTHIAGVKKTAYCELFGLVRSRLPGNPPNV